MPKKLKILGINGSASKHSSNLALLNQIAKLGKPHFELTIIYDLTILPHFQTELAANDVPDEVTKFHNSIEGTDGVVICTPEYVFSVPSGLKNAIEWCVSTTVFSHKPVATIIAAASGEKAYESLSLIMTTIEAVLPEESKLLIQGAKGKVNVNSEITDSTTLEQLENVIQSLISTIKNEDINGYI